MDTELLKAYNDYDRTLEKYRDIEISELKADFYSGAYTDEEYLKKFNTIYDSYEIKMYRAWLTK